MSKSAAPAKLSVPRTFGTIPRERLYALLDRNHDRPLLWICGPPGAGKTVLVADFLAERHRYAFWYQIDSGDTDPATLFHYLTRTSDAAAVKGSEGLPKFLPEHQADLNEFARLYFRAFFARAPGNSILVFDNCQEAMTDRAFQEIIRQAVIEAAPGCVIIAISRVEAPPGFAPFTASGAMSTIRWDQLQLTLEEVRAIAAQRNLKDDTLVQTLHQQSDGWAAGITLMLEHLGGPDGESNHIPDESYESVFNYFATFLFNQASTVTRRTLLGVACLPHFSPTMARTVSGCEDAPQVLQDLYRRHLFTDRKPGPEPVYQLHALFRDFLRQRAREDLGAQAYAQHLSRCALALESAHEIEAAMDLWLDAMHFEQATALVLRCAASVLHSGRRQTLARWIHSIPLAIQDRQPWLGYWMGCTEQQVEPEQSLKTLALALERFRALGDRRGQIECLTALLRGAFVGFHALHIMERWLDDLLVEMAQPFEFVDTNTELKVMATLCVSLFHIKPWHPLTQTTCRRAEALLPHDAAPDIALSAASSLIVVTSLCGDFDRGDAIVQATLALAQRSTASPSDAAWWFAHAGYLRFLEARYIEAHDFLEQGRCVAECSGLRSVLEIILLWRSSVEWRLSGRSVASATLALVELSPGPRIAMREAIRFQYQARAALRRGLIDEAASLACESDAAVMRSGSRLQELVFGLCNADILIHTGRMALAEPLLTRSRLLINRAPIYDCWRATQVWLESWLARGRGDAGTAAALLKEALHLAGQGKRRYFLRLPDFALVPQLVAALDTDIETDRVLEIIDALHIQPPLDAPDRWPWPVRIFTLGRFEVQVRGQPLEFSRKVPRKTLRLLKVLVVFGGREVSADLLCDELWSDEEGDAAINALGVTVVRLRKLLGGTDTISYQGGMVSLNRQVCWVDAWAFEKRLTIPASGSHAIDRYQGTFLPEDLSEPWSVALRERLRDKFVRALSAHAADLESKGEMKGAMDSYLRGIDADPIIEGFHEGLMRCYERLGQRTQAISAYRRLKHTLCVLLGVPPSDGTRRLFEEILDRQQKEAHISDLSPEEVVHGQAPASQGDFRKRVVTDPAPESRSSRRRPP